MQLLNMFFFLLTNLKNFEEQKNHHDYEKIN